MRSCRGPPPLTPPPPSLSQLQDLSCGETLEAVTFDRGGELSDSQSALLWAILGALGEEEVTSASSGESALLGAAHLLVSALEGDLRSFRCFLCLH